MFKVGNSVRVLPNYSYGKLKAGETYTITRIHNSGRGYDEIFLKDVPNFYNSTGYHPCRFELVEEGFNISTATDQELADEYHRMNKERQPVYAELMRRGYKMYNKNGNMPLKVYVEVEFRKTETKSIVL